MTNALPAAERASTTGNPPVRDEAYVLHARPLRPEASLEETSRFGDDLWRLEPALLQLHQKALTLDFQTLPAAHLMAAKVLSYALLSGPLPPGERRPSVVHVRTAFTELKRFYTWLGDHAPNASVPELTRSDLLSYQFHLHNTLPAQLARTRARTAVRLLWRWREVLSHVGGALSLDPRHLRGWGETRSGTAIENSTDRIPEQVLGPLIGWALRFVDDLAPDILAAAQCRLEMQRSTRIKNVPRETIGAHLAQTLDDYRDRQARLPGHRGRLNIYFLAQVVGCTRDALGPHADTLTRAAAELGVDEYSAYGTPITATVDGALWTDGIASHHNAPDGLARLSRHLQIVGMSAWLGPTVTV